jgi:hypothetical protein
MLEKNRTWVFFGLGFVSSWLAIILYTRYKSKVKVEKMNPTDCKKLKEKIDEIRSMLETSRFANEQARNDLENTLNGLMDTYSQKCMMQFDGRSDDNRNYLMPKFGIPRIIK